MPSLAQLFVASLGLGCGACFARWACQQIAGQVNVVIMALYSRAIRQRLRASVFCAQCAGPCRTVLVCEDPACGFTHVGAGSDVPERP